LKRKPLSIAEIAAKALIRKGHTSFAPADESFLLEVFSECVNRRVMKRSLTDWKHRVLEGVSRSQGFVKRTINGETKYYLVQKHNGINRI
jgi:hypothetical protein